MQEICTHLGCSRPFVGDSSMRSHVQEYQASHRSLFLRFRAEAAIERLLESSERLSLQLIYLRS